MYLLNISKYYKKIENITVMIITSCIYSSKLLWGLYKYEYIFIYLLWKYGYAAVFVGLLLQLKSRVGFELFIQEWEIKFKATNIIHMVYQYSNHSLTILWNIILVPIIPQTDRFLVELLACNAMFIRIYFVEISTSYLYFMNNLSWFVSPEIGKCGLTRRHCDVCREYTMLPC